MAISLEHRNAKDQMFLKFLEKAPFDNAPVHLTAYVIKNTRTQQGIRFKMGMGIPTVFPKQVPWVWVWFWILAHHSTLCTHSTVLWVFCG